MKKALYCCLAVLAGLAGGSCKKASTDTGDAAPTASSEAATRTAAVKAAEGALAKNKAILVGLNVDTLPRWTPTEQRRRYILATEPDSDTCAQDASACGVTYAWCPAANAIYDAPVKDEFDMKKQRDALLKARQTCLGKMRAAAGGMPDLALVEVALEAASYDFTAHNYLLEGKDRDGASFVGTTWSRGTFVFGPSTVSPTSCRAKNGDGDEVGLLVVQNAAGPSLGPARTWESGCSGDGCDWLCALLTTNDEAAQVLKPRLSADSDLLTAKPSNGKTRDISTLLRLQLVFRPGAYGDAEGRTCVLTTTMDGRPVTMGEKKLRAFVGTGVGYRVVDKQGVLIDWTPVGPSL